MRLQMCNLIEDIESVGMRAIILHLWITGFREVSNAE